MRPKPRPPSPQKKKLQPSNAAAPITPAFHIRESGGMLYLDACAGAFHPIPESEGRDAF